MTITEFLEARIAEDEAAAREAAGWTASGPSPEVKWIGEPGDHLITRLGGAGPHIARHDPARVLAECAAKRAVLALHPVTMQLWWDEQCEIDVCATCQEDSYPDSWPCATVKHLAAVYADHPAYRPEWSA